MKTLNLVVLASIFITFSAMAGDPVLLCNSHQNVEGWTGIETNAKVQLTAYYGHDGNLTSAEVRGAYYSDRAEILHFSPMSDFWDDYVSYDPLVDNWNSFRLFLPIDLPNSNTFDGYLEVISDDTGDSKVIEMSCYIK